MQQPNLFELTCPQECRALDPAVFAGQLLSAAEITHLLRICEALWLHSGDPLAPHAILSSGLCGSGLIDVLRAVRHTNLCAILAHQMAARVRAKLDEDGYRRRIDWVVGSDHASAAFSHSVAGEFAALHDFTEKSADGQQQHWRRFEIGPEETVLQVEELITTARTVLAVREGIQRGNPSPVEFVPVIATLVHHSDHYEIAGSPVVYLVHYEISVWQPDACPLCRGGSKRLHPRRSWQELASPTGS